jgi:hypothetical protein
MSAAVGIGMFSDMVDKKLERKSDNAAEPGNPI